MRIIVKEHMWILVIAISVVVISGVIGDAYPKRVALDTANSDQDFEMIEIERKEQAVRDPDESSLSSAKNVYEMGIALCFTQDRTRTCDCGFLNQVRQKNGHSQGSYLLFESDSPTSCVSVPGR